MKLTLEGGTTRVRNFAMLVKHFGNPRYAQSALLLGIVYGYTEMLSLVIAALFVLL